MEPAHTDTTTASPRVRIWRRGVPLAIAAVAAAGRGHAAAAAGPNPGRAEPNGPPGSEVTIPDDPELAARDLVAACSLLADIPNPVDIRDDSWSFDGSNLWRFQAVTAAFVAAGNGDESLADLAELGNDALSAFQRFGDVDEFLDPLRIACDEQGASGSDPEAAS